MVTTGSLAEDVDEAVRARCEKAQQFIRWENGHLWVGERRVPPVHERPLIIREAAAQLGHPDGQRLYAHLRERYYWWGMQRDVLVECSAALGVQVEAAGFKLPRYLIPTAKDLAPFAVWSVDLVVKLRPVAPGGGRYLVVAVCAFSKWVEAGILRTKHAAEVAAWFHTNITCRFGVALLVRTDRGTEFAGAFAAYLRSAGVQQALISVRHPRANGLVERYNGCIKAGLRKLKSSFPTQPWYELLGDVLAGLRMLPGKLGVSPFLVVYKQSPVWVGDSVGFRGGVSPESDLREEGVQVELLTLQMRWWDEAAELIRERLRDRDRRMLESYMRAQPGLGADVRFAFSPGDLVILRPALRDKSLPRADGPFVFVRYSRTRVSACIRDARGGERVVSVANLLPLRADTWSPEA